MDLFSLKDDCRQWIGAMWRPFLAYIVALLLVAVLAGSRHGGLIVLAGLVLLATSIWFGHRIRRERRQAMYRVGRARLAVAALLALLSLGVMLLSGLDPAFDVPAFAGLGILVVSIGGLISEARHYRRWEHVRGPVVLGVAFVLIATSLIFHPKSAVFLVVVGLSLLLADLGTELHSEDRLRTVPEWNPWVLAALGVLLTFVAVGLLVSWGAGLTGGVIFATVVLVVVWMATSDSESLLLVVVIAFALIWSSAPRDVERDENLEARKGSPYYLVLGDSYISGEGAERFYEGTNTSERNAKRTNTCRRAPSAWPVQLSAKPRPPGIPDRVLFIPCSGAESENIRSTPPLNQKGELRGAAELKELEDERRERGLTEPPRFVLLSVAGNDAGFGTVGKTCVGPGTCAEVGDKFLEELARVEAQLDVTYRDVRAAVGADVPVITVPYPIPVSDSGACPDVFLTESERKFVVQFVMELNAVVRSAASRAGFEYMDTMERALVEEGKRLCDGPNPSGLNFLSWHPQAGNLWQSLTPTNWTHNSLHPNEDGHEAMRAAAVRWFETHADVGARQPSGEPPRVIRRMDEMLRFGTTSLCVEGPQKEACALEGNGWLYEQAFRLISSSFLPTLLAMVGAWMIVMAPIRHAMEHGITTAAVVARIIAFIRRR